MPEDTRGRGEAGTEHSGFTLDESRRVGGAVPPSSSNSQPCSAILPTCRLADQTHAWITEASPTLGTHGRPQGGATPAASRGGWEQS